MHRRRVAVAALVGTLVGTAGLLTGAVAALGLGGFAAGVAVGALSRSRLDDIGVEGFVAGGLTCLGLYLAGLATVVVRAGSSPILGDALYVLGTFGFSLLVFAFPGMGVLGALGSFVSYRVCTRLRPAA